MGRLSARDSKVDSESAFVLHSTPWRETSLVVELLTQSHGRVAVVAKGAKRANSAMRALQLSFQPILVNWTGQGELKTLTRADWQGGLSFPEGQALFCGFYLNELMMRLLTRDDPCSRLYQAYRQTLVDLQVTDDANVQSSLRRFEWIMLSECGYGLDLKRCSLGAPLDEQGCYAVQASAALKKVKSNESVSSESLVLTGSQVNELRQWLELDWQNMPHGQRLLPAHLMPISKIFMRVLLSVPLEGKPLKTRQILRELEQL